MLLELPRLPSASWPWVYDSLPDSLVLGSASWPWVYDAASESVVLGPESWSLVYDSQTVVQSSPVDDPSDAQNSSLVLVREITMVTVTDIGHLRGLRIQI